MSLTNVVVTEMSHRFQDGAITLQIFRNECEVDPDAKSFKYAYGWLGSKNGRWFDTKGNLPENWSPDQSRLESVDPS